MPRPLALLSALSVIGLLLVPQASANAAPLPSQTVVANAELQEPLASPQVAPVPVAPDVAYSTNQGGRVEVYTSTGDNNGGVDWRPVNEFAYLINSVPKGKQLHATIYNTLWDGDKAKYDAATDKWAIYDSTGKVLRTTDTFGPTQALLNQLNQYTKAERGTYIQLLLSKKSMRDANAAGSGLASLIYGAGSSIYTECTNGNGACLITPDVDEEALMHAKYALFEQAKDSTGKLWNDVVWITSANLNGASGGKKSNTSIAIFGEPKGYTALLDKVWKAEVTQDFTADYLASIPGIAGTNSDFTFYPSPRKNTRDAVPPDFEAQFLKDSTNAKLGGTKTACKAYLVHSLFSETRVDILKALAVLQQEGCSVKIVLGENAIGAIVTTYFSMSSAVRDVIDRTEFANVHDKTLTLSYDLNGTNYGSAWGGSENFNGTSLRYDELQFHAKDLTLTRAVEQQSERLYQFSRGGETNTPVKAITVLPYAPQINDGGTVQLRARVSPSNATIRQVTWKSDNTSVATVDAVTGKVTGTGVGTATITATSVSSWSGHERVKGSMLVTVNNDSAPQNTTDPGEAAVVVSSPPTLTMGAAASGQPYQEPGTSTHVVVTWGQAGTDLSGRVTLQYYSSGKWHSYTSFNVTGRVEKDFTLKSTKTWRLRADAVTSPSGASITSTGKYSNGYSYMVVRTAGATTKPRLYAPSLIKGVGSKIPMVVSWKGSSNRTIVIQYKTKSGHWVSLADNKYSMTTNNKLVGATTAGSRYWRVVGLKKGSSSKASSSVYVKVAG